MIFGQRKKCVLSLTVLLVLGVIFGSISPRGGAPHMRTRVKTTKSGEKPNDEIMMRSAVFPPELLKSVYSSSDFVNRDGVSPVFWTPDMINCTDEKNNCNQLSEWGPCYPPQTGNNWTDLIHISRERHGVLRYPTKPTHPDSYARIPNPNLAGYCRPGFIIIGAGKCGTSSLYHYIVGHPRVLPAKKKQIHYFKVSDRMFFYPVTTNRFMMCHFWLLTYFCLHSISLF